MGSDTAWTEPYHKNHLRFISVIQMLNNVNHSAMQEDVVMLMTSIWFKILLDLSESTKLIKSQQPRNSLFSRLQICAILGSVTWIQIIKYLLKKSFVWLIDIGQEIFLAYNVFPFDSIRLWNPHLWPELHLLQEFVLLWNHGKYRFHRPKEFPGSSPASQRIYMVPSHILLCPCSLFAKKRFKVCGLQSLAKQTSSPNISITVWS